MRRSILVAAFLVALLGAAGCGSQDLRAMRLGEQARALAAELSGGGVVVRHNPPPCQCAPFEVRLGERWVRLELIWPDGEPEVVSRGEAALVSAGISGKRVSLRLDSSKPQFCPNGSVYFVARVLEPAEPQ